jgi:hypothetical protein
MRIALRYLVNGATAQVLFGPKRSKVPVLFKAGLVNYYEWGARKLPAGGTSVVTLMFDACTGLVGKDDSQIEK